MLTIQHVNKKYGKDHALQDVSMTIPQGSCYGLIGPNGAGKSTLMKIIATIIQADHGEVTYDGMGINNEVKRNFGYIPQEISLEQRVTARENLKFFGRFYDLKGSELEKRTEEVLHYVGLTERGSRKVKTFSGGMKRRLNIGCGLMNKPAFILMDEPTVGIDPQSRRYIFNMIDQLKQDGCTILYASHYIEEVEQICDEAAFIDHGKIVESGKISSLLKKHTQPAVFVQSDLDLPQTIQQAGNITEQNEGYIIDSDQPLETMKLVIQAFEDSSEHLHRLELIQPRLEDVFFMLTGSKLRD